MPYKYPHRDRQAPKSVHIYPSAKGVGLETGARVQIPQSASKADNKRIYCVCYRLCFLCFYGSQLHFIAPYYPHIYPLKYRINTP